MQDISTIPAARSSTRDSLRGSNGSSGRDEARLSALAQSATSAGHGAPDLRPCRSEGADVPDAGRERDGRFWEYEKLEVVARLADKVDVGHLQLYCIEGLAREPFYDS